MARERARKGEERREGVQGGKMVEALAGREVFFGRNFFLSLNLWQGGMEEHGGTRGGGSKP